jgi:hypothetical protein
MWFAAPGVQAPGGKATVEVGFGLGPLNRAEHYAAALHRVRADGFRIIRVYEPFLKGDGGTVPPIVRHLKFLDSLGFTPYFDLSDFPHALAPAAHVAAFPQGKRDAAFRFTNRYAPPPAAFDSLVGSVLAGLDQAFGREKLRQWYIEIGNEPDAAQFFWGTPEAFTGLMDAAERRVWAFDSSLRLGGGAFTSALVSHPDQRAGYAALARRLAASPHEFTSFHIYGGSAFHKEFAARVNALLGPPNGRLRVISEWNVSSRPVRETQTILDSPDAMGPYLIEMLAGAADAGVRIVLIHKLQDEPGNGELGLFDADGREKGGYRLVRMAAAFARQGFSVVRDAGSVRLEGDSLRWIEAGDAPVMLDPSDSVVAPALVAGRLAPHGWALLRRKSR